jgi:hypothetical protein
MHDLQGIRRPSALVPRREPHSCAKYLQIAHFPSRFGAALAPGGSLR